LERSERLGPKLRELGALGVKLGAGVERSERLDPKLRVLGALGVKLGVGVERSGALGALNEGRDGVPANDRPELKEGALERTDGADQDPPNERLGELDPIDGLDRPEDPPNDEPPKEELRPEEPPELPPENDLWGLEDAWL